MVVQTTDIVIGAVSGFIYGGGTYLKRRQEGEVFDAPKFAGSLLIGMGVGSSMAYAGFPITEDAIMNGFTMLATMGGTKVIEDIFRYIYRAIFGV